MSRVELLVLGHQISTLQLSERINSHFPLALTNRGLKPRTQSNFYPGAAEIISNKAAQNVFTSEIKVLC